MSSLEKYILPYKTLIQITDLSKKFGVFLDTPFYLTQQFCTNSKGISLSHFYDIKPINQIETGEIARFPNLLKFDLDMLIYSMQIPDLRSKQNSIVLTVLLKGKYQKKNVSKDSSLDSISKKYFDFDKLWPKIRDWRLFKMPNFYYFLVMEKFAKNLHFLQFDTLFKKKTT